VQRSRVDTAVRTLADDAARGLTQPWNASVHRAAMADVGDLADGLDRAVVGTDLQVSEKPAWVRAVSAVQFVGLLAALVGLGWMAALLALQLSGSATPEPPRAAGLSLPLILLVGGLLLGWLLSVVSATFADRSAARAARVADRQLRAAVSDVAAEGVVSPIESELGAYERARSALSRLRQG
jgi:hypothetical protein